MNRLLVINLGGTSSKVAVMEDEQAMFITNVKHERDEFQQITDLWDQYDFRKAAILAEVESKGFKLADFNAFVSRGAPVRPMKGGCYRINQAMVDDAKSKKYGNHPCSIGCSIVLDLANEYKVPALTVDAPCIDEMIPEAKVTGWKGVERKSFFQALNQKAIGRKLATTLGKKYDEMNAIIVHMGGGLSIAAHQLGKVIDVNNGLDGDGPMAMERAGTLPAGELLKASYSGEFTYEELYIKVNGKGGMYAHLGTKDGIEIEKRIESGDKQAKLIYDAMIYQIAKSIGSAAVSLRGKAEAIAFTGGLAYSKYLIKEISEQCGFLAPIHLFPGEDEIASLTQGALFALSGEWPIQEY